MEGGQEKGGIHPTSKNRWEETFHDMPLGDGFVNGSPGIVERIREAGQNIKIQNAAGVINLGSSPCLASGPRGPVSTELTGHEGVGHRAERGQAKAEADQARIRLGVRSVGAPLPLPSSYLTPSLPPWGAVSFPTFSLDRRRSR